jgi:hypothetical protein
MLRPLIHHRHHWTNEEWYAACVVGIIVVFAITIAILLHLGVGVV